MSWVYDTESDRDWVPIFQWFQQNKIGCIYPRSVGAHCRVISSDDTKIEGYQPEQSDDRAPQSYAVKPLGYPDLPLPETPFVGAMLLIFGWWGNNRGIERGPLWLLMVGWVIAVIGGLVSAPCGLSFVLWFATRAITAIHL